ncbi:MAG: hypothetical protein R3C58_15255 [Parvularculaceae bacterium]
MKSGIGQLSAERVGAEMSGILSLPRASFALNAMAETQILAEVWPAAPDLAAAERMKSLEPAAAAPLMLAALWGDEGDGVGARLRLSNAEKSVRFAALTNAGDIAPSPSAHDLRAHLYRLGKDVAADAALLAAARGALDDKQYRDLVRRIDETAPPVFSISGRHIVDAGVAPGPDVSRLLAAIETQWIAEDFPGETRQREILKDVLAAKN